MLLHVIDVFRPFFGYNFCAIRGIHYVVTDDEKMQFPGILTMWLSLNKSIRYMLLSREVVKMLVTNFLFPLYSGDT